MTRSRGRARDVFLRYHSPALHGRALPAPERVVLRDPSFRPRRHAVGQSRSDDIDEDRHFRSDVDDRDAGAMVMDHEGVRIPPAGHSAGQRNTPAQPASTSGKRVSVAVFLDADCLIRESDLRLCIRLFRHRRSAGLHERHQGVEGCPTDRLHTCERRAGRWTRLKS